MNPVIEDLYWLSSNTKKHDYSADEIKHTKQVFIESRCWRGQKNRVAFSLKKMAIIKSFK